MFPHPVRSPDEAAALKDAEFLLVGGRVEAVEDQGLILSGALGSLRVRLRLGASAGTRELQPGWLIVVQGALEAGVLVQASALHVQPAPLPTPQGEHARLDPLECVAHRRRRQPPAGRGQQAEGAGGGGKRHPGRRARPGGGIRNG